jgi:hypothetical protein
MFLRVKPQKKKKTVVKVEMLPRWAYIDAEIKAIQKKCLFFGEGCYYIEK